MRKEEYRILYPVKTFAIEQCKLTIPGMLKIVTYINESNYKPVSCPLTKTKPDRSRNELLDLFSFISLPKRWL